MEITSSLTILTGIIIAWRRLRLVAPPLFLPMAVFIFLVTLNVALTPSLGTSLVDRLSETPWILTYLGLFYCLNTTWDQDFFQRILLTTWLILLTITTAQGVYQFLSGDDLFRSTVDHLPAAGSYFRATGFFSLCLTFAYSMGVSGLTLSLPLKKINKWGPHIAFALGFICIFISLTRGAWLALGLTIPLIFFIYFKHIRPRHIVNVVGFLVIFMALIITTKGGLNRVDKIVSSRVDVAVTQRFDLWRAYFEMFKSNPIFGVGIEMGPEYVLEKYEKLGIESDFVSHAHNDFIQMLGETGIIGFSAFLFLVLFTMWKTYQLRHYRLDWSASLLAGQIFVFLGSMTQANFTDAEVNHFLIFNWAIASVLIVRAKAASKDATLPKDAIST